MARCDGTPQQRTAATRRGEWRRRAPAVRAQRRETAAACSCCMQRL